MGFVSYLNLQCKIIVSYHTSHYYSVRFVRQEPFPKPAYLCLTLITYRSCVVNCKCEVMQRLILLRGLMFYCILGQLSQKGFFLSRGFLINSDLLLYVEGWNTQVKIPRMLNTIQVNPYNNTQGCVDVMLKYNIVHSWKLLNVGSNSNVYLYILL